MTIEEPKFLPGALVRESSPHGRKLPFHLDEALYDYEFKCWYYLRWSNYGDDTWYSESEIEAVQ